MKKSPFALAKKRAINLTSILIVFSFLINLLILAIPIYMLQVYSRVITSYSVDTLWLLTAIVVFALLTMTLIDIARAMISKSMGHWFSAQFAPDMLRQAIKYKMRTGKNHTKQILHDFQVVRSFLGGNGIYPILDAPWTPMFILVVYLMHPMLGHLAVVGTVVLFSLAVLNEMVSRKTLAEVDTRTIFVSQNAENAAVNSDSILGMGMMNEFLERWYNATSDMNDIEHRSGSRSLIISNCSKFFRSGLQVALIGVGAWLVIQHEITAGVMIASSILMARALSPVEQAIGTWSSASSAWRAYQRLNELSQLEISQEIDMPLPRPKGNIRVSNLTYRHPMMNAPTLSNLSFDIPAGKAIGIIGPSGTGKSTLVKLLLGNLHPTAGKVELDGMNVAHWAKEDLGRYCGYMSQDTELFAVSIRENIARLKVEQPDKVIEAAQLTGCHEMILKKPKGYDFVVGENGAGLSGGERQRVAMARAIYGDPSLVVFDEANANLDGEGEVAFQQLIQHLKEKGVTVVVIAHSAGALRNVDRLLSLRKGQLHLYGGREQVLSAMMQNQSTDIPKVENG
ncbi:type I secretion system permease/ATPase [Vibrio maerlii]|uniref:type I secretion system permease/ATPase n=1 Tax=Vibrio maerlii TaxID=2231648 RepID=UPI000E3D5FB4|nr:type I secretion system permease/ATPase [Vibrio maerlii]